MALKTDIRGMVWKYPDTFVVGREQIRQYAKSVKATDPDFFSGLSGQQSPEYLWIGCSDSRVPANQITDLAPGEIFVHRNVANVVAETDFNVLAVLQYAVDVIKVKHIIVCGHYGCGGVKAALTGDRLGLVDNWLAPLAAVRERHAGRIAQCAGEREQHDLLCELNVIEQAAQICRSTVVERAWSAGRPLTVHGWIYGLHDGRIRDLEVSRHTPQPRPGVDAEWARQLPPACQALLTARESDIVQQVDIRTSAPDCMWGQDYGT